MDGVGVVTVHQRLCRLTVRQRLAGKRFAAVVVDPAMQRSHVDVCSRRQEKSPFGERTASCGCQGALLPVQEHLIVLQHLVVADVLQPAGSQTDQQPWQS